MRKIILFALLPFMLAAAAHADVAINAGGPAVTGYMADRYYSGGGAWYYGGLPGVYNTERWTNSSFSYNIPVSAGKLQVTLLFRESCGDCTSIYGGPNIENVAINGTRVLSSFTLPLGQQYSGVYVIDNPTTILNIRITALQGEAYINAIQVVQLAVTTPAPTVSISASPTVVDSGGVTNLTWSSTKATSCSASGAWSGARPTSGTETSAPLTANSSFTLTCTGDGGTSSQTASVTVNSPVPAPSLSLTANPLNVAMGTASTLTWTSANATDCTASDGWSGSKGTAGTQSSGLLSATTKFTLTCTGTGGFATQSVTITITSTPPLAPTVSLSASPTSIASGGNATLTWSSTNATSCTASGGWSGAQSTSGTQSTGALTASTSYTLSCSNGAGSASQTALVTVVPRPTVALSANPTSVVSGTASTLTWSSTNATSCTASGGWSGATPTSGTASTPLLTTSTTFTLTCSGTGGSRSRSVIVSVSASPPPTVTLAANPTAVASGSASTLTWSSTNATSCTASLGWSGTKAISGTQSTGAITAATSYRLTCTGSGGSANQTVQVTLLPAPVVSLTANPTSVASGGTSTLTWSAANATSCAASGGWSGNQPTSGTATTAALTSSTSFTLTCVGAGGSGSATTTVTIQTPTVGLFPLQNPAHTATHYLIDAQGRPFLINGDTPWDLLNRLTDAEADAYLADRQAKGINTVFVELMEHYPWTSPSHVPNNVYGDPPFTTKGDFSTPNEAYMAHVATFLQNALNRGMLVMITPAYAGFVGAEQGWYVEMEANGTAKLRTYGQYLANRFAAYPNIIWVQGGDYSPSDHTLIDAIANGIRDVNTTWLQTFHGGRYTNALDYTTAAWLTLNAIYTDGSTIVSQANKEYAKSTMPFFLVESAYETGSAGDGGLVRPQVYADYLSGATGYLLGYEDLWPFPTGWQSLMNSEGARAMKYAGQLWTSRSWWLLVPDGTGKAAYAANGSFGFAYGAGGSVTVNLAKFSGPNVRAQWYDPTNGTYSAVSGSPFAASGTRTLSHGTSNAAGGSDWALVLDSQ